MHDLHHPAHPLSTRSTLAAALVFVEVNESRYAPGVYTGDRSRGVTITTLYNNSVHKKVFISSKMMEFQISGV